MWRTVLHLLILVQHICLSPAFCPENQKAFKSSCYEFVGVQRSFFSAQAWCEQSGGHLAFIPDEDTQYFLQRHLDPEKDVWFGAALSTNLQFSPTAEGSLSWLDGSRITYSNWVSSPQQGAACGHILRNSGFKWEAMKDCNKRLNFICQFEWGSSIVCAGHDTTLQCSSGQVLMIDGGFYGRKNVHYCRSALSLPIISKHQCGWVDVVESLSAHCRDRQVCQVAEVVNSFGEPCPQLGSYLSVDYQCRDGLTLIMRPVAAVYNDINISVKWLLDLSWGIINCKLNTGDGQVISMDSPEEVENGVVHMYTHPSAFVVAVECISNDIHITVQKIITIQEPVTEIGVIRCYAGNLFFHATNCKALYGWPFQIQMQVKAGTNVTYRIQRDKVLLSSSSVVRGNVPHNVTVTREMVKYLGPGCHQLIIHASNMVTFPGVSTDLQVCVLEKVAGIQASMLTERNDCVDSPDITVGVFLERGAPVLLLFALTGDNNSSFCETREMNTRKDIFHIEHQIEGTVQGKVRAWNVFSSLEVDMFSSCGKDSAIKLNSHNGHKQLGFTKKPRNKHIRVVRSPNDINIFANPSNSVPTRNTTITLSTSSLSKLNDSSKKYQWLCNDPCQCQKSYDGLTYTITQACLPDPYHFNKYYFNVINRSNDTVESSEFICIIFAPKSNVPTWLSLTCTQGCDPENETTDAIFNLDCKGNQQCQDIVWNIVDLNDNDWPNETKSCYQDAKERPLIQKQKGGTKFTVNNTDINMAKSMQQDLTVVIYSEDVVPIYTTYTIQTSSSTNYHGSKSAIISQQPVYTDATNEDGSNGGRKTTTRPDATPDTSSRDNHNLFTPFTATKTPVSSDATTKDGSTEGKRPSAHPATTPDTSSTDKHDPNPATTTKQPIYTGTTVKPGSTEEKKPSSPSATETKQPAYTGTTTKAGSIEGKSTTTHPTTTNGRISANTVTGHAASTSHKTSPTTTNNSGKLSCSISPSNGTILDAFNITCRTNFPCSKCQYCFKIKGKYLRCSMNNEVKSVFLPLGDSSANYSVIITATVQHGNIVVSTFITTQVKDSALASVDVLKNSVESTVDQLKDQGLLTGETVAQLFSSVSSQLNSQSTESTNADQQMLREKMLDIMINTVNEVPASSPVEVEAIAGGLSAVVQKGTELSSSAQEQASLLFMNLSSSLLHMNVTKNKENKDKINSAASTIVEGASNILDSSSNKNNSGVLLNALYNIQSALLMFQDVNEAPTIIQQANIAVFVMRVKPGSLHTEPITIPNCSCPAFSLPVLPSNLFPSKGPVDVRMLSLNTNPFSWNGRGNISGPIGGLTLTTTDSSTIPVENLTEDIEILLPRPAGEQVNISILDLGNYSTTIIDVPSADSTLLLKMVPSKDPLPFQLFLGYMAYPTETNYAAMTDMPQMGTTQEERYTWLIDPKILKGNTGTYYLVVRPIVGPGIKSINASLSITSITASCKFWNESASDWRTYGCRVGANTTHAVTQCLCNHLTFFGSSFFVTPNLVDPSRTAELFGTFTQNPVVVCFVGALFVAYLLVVAWARRKDIKDKGKVKLTILNDNNPMDEYRYLLTVSTGHRRGASTSSQVTITLLGTEGNSEPHHLSDQKKRLFERGAVDMFLLTTAFSLGDLQAIRLWHNNTGRHPAWFVGNVMVQDLQTDQKWHFLCNSWLAIDVGTCSLDKVFPVSTEMDIKRFRNLFFMKATKDFSDGHLWYSVINRPPGSTFTCVQRVSCCFSLLLCTMLTSIMFYGIPTDPSEQVMELGQFEFTWQQFMIGVQSSLIMFPVNFLIVAIFRQTRPREMSCCKRKTGKADALELESTSQTSSSQTAANNMNANVTLDGIINDITKITHSLSKNVKSTIPCPLGPGQQVDISDVLSVVEDFIRQNNKTSENTQSKTKRFSNVIQPQIPESNDYVHPGSTEDGIQKKSNKMQYLYRQLCRIHKELSLLGPSGFPTPHSYSQALQQVQRMKGFLEDQLFTSNSVNPNELTQKKLSSAESSDGSQKKTVCCHSGLPWWFIFVGWLLVIATSFIAGYFTMLYGLKFGKPRSVSWLVSMIISFFQSLLIIQPLKVLCLAVFFALVIKKVDEEDFQNVAYLRNDTYLGDFNEQPAVRQNRNVYEPPPLADVEKMKKNKIMEQKAFALFREILIYVLFMAMLLLVAYTQRDPNAFYLNQHILNSFSGGILSCMRLEDVFTWARTSLLSKLFGVFPGFITDGNSKLMGSARLRQLRVKQNSCQIAGPMLQILSECDALYSWEAEDMGSYDPGWNHSVKNNISTGTFSPWMYQTQAQLRAYNVWGTLALYRAGGFVAELGPNLESASSTLEDLFNNKWLDTYTRAIFVEFTVYNANVNLFCIVTLLLETPAIGAFQFTSELHNISLYPSDDGLYYLVVAAEIIYLLFILYYMFLQGKLLKQQRWAYFRSKWNLLELTIILLSWSAVGVFIKMTLLGNHDMTYYQNHQDQFASFYDAATSESELEYVVAFLVLLSTIKLWHLLRLNPNMYMITATLKRAWNDISSFLVVIVVMFLAYSIASNVIYGWKLSTYQTLDKTLLALVGMQIGIFNYDEVLNYTPLLGGLLFGSCIVLVTFVVLNLLISVVLVAFHHERIYHKPSEEEEVVDVMLKKICSLFGIGYKDTKKIPGSLSE